MSSRFTPEVRETIVTALRQNPSIPSAAVAAGIHTNTLRRWLQEGEEGNPEYSAFALEAAEARSVMKDSIVAALLETALDPMHPQQTKAAHQLLTNLFPQEFSVVRHHVQHQSEKVENIDLSKVPTEDLRQLMKTLKRIKGGKPNPASELALPEVIEVSTPDSNGKSSANADRKEQEGRQ
jgi:transposase-like protein